MSLSTRRWVHPALLAVGIAIASAPSARGQGDLELTARARILPEIGPGLRALKQDSSGRLYVLTAPGPVVLIYNNAGKRAGQVPAAGAKQGDLVFGSDLDVDAAGRVCIADRGANAVKVFAPDGTLVLAIAIPAPASVAALPDGEVAVTSLNSKQLVAVFDAHGTMKREFGDPSDVSERPELNRYLNVGRIAADSTGHIYYAFTFLPVPTIRKYDRYGYASFETRVATPEFEPRASAARRAIQHQETSGGPPSLAPLVNAIAVEPQSHEVWIAAGDELLLFDADGNHRATYRTYTDTGASLSANAIVVQPDRLLLGADPLGIFEFQRPDKTSSP